MCDKNNEDDGYDDGDYDVDVDYDDVDGDDDDDVHYDDDQMRQSSACNRIQWSPFQWGGAQLR